MSDSARNFVIKFHNLGGDTVKSKQNALYQLFLENAALKDNESDLEYVTLNLNPTNHLERIFRVDFLVHFRRFHELFVDFKNGDDITLHKVLKHDWFFQNVRNETIDQDFVTKVLPTLSYSLKVKLLKKLPIGETEADVIFDQLYERYGIHFSTVFLPKCTKTKIRDVLKEFPIQLTVGQLKKISAKDPGLIYVYIEERVKHLGNSKFLDKNPILVYIAQNNPKIFSDLYEKYKFETSLGRRTTKTLIKNDKDSVISKLDSYLSILNKSAMVRRLGPQIKNILFKPHPSTQQPIYNIVLDYYPKNKQFEIYKSQYNSVFQRKFGENIDQVTANILKRIPDAKERETLAKLKYEKEGNRDFLIYMTPEHCLEEFSQKMNNMSSADRADYVQKITKSCIQSNDLNTLLKISEMMVTRFKNDDKKIKHSYLSALYGQKIVERFTEDHWKHQMDLIMIMDALNEGHFGEVQIRANYFKFLVKNNKDLKAHILKYPGWVKEYLAGLEEFGDPLICVPYMNVLLELGAIKPDPNNKSASAEYDCLLACMCSRLYARNRKNIIKILDYPRVLTSAKEILNRNENDWYWITGIKYILCQDGTSNELQELRNLYLEKFQDPGSLHMCQWFLKHEPQILRNCYDNVLKTCSRLWNCNERSRALWRLIKKHTHLELDSRAIEFCISKLLQEGCPSYEFKQKVVVFSMLATPDAYLEQVKSRLPTTIKVDLSNEETKVLFEIQTALVRHLHLLNSPQTVLPIVLQFCKGDYLQHALPSLYSSMYKLPEFDTKPYAEEIGTNRAIAVKKHQMHFSCVLYDKCSAVDSLTNFAVPALLPIWKYFAKNPSETLWQLLATQIVALDKNDLLLLKRGVGIKVPVVYRSRYVEAVWKILDKYNDKEVKKLLLNEIKSEKYLESNVSYQIIQSSIFKLQEANEFIANFFIRSDAKDRFSFLKKILQEFKNKDWNVKDMRRNLHKLVSVLFVKYMETEETNQEFVSQILAVFKSVFPLYEAFAENVLIACMGLKNQSVDVCSKLLLELNKIFSFDNHGTGFLADILEKSVMKYVFKTNNERIKLCYSLFQNKQTLNDYLLIIRLLPKGEPDITELYTQHDAILTELSHVDTDVIRLYYNLYFKLTPGSNWDEFAHCN